MRFLTVCILVVSVFRASICFGNDDDQTMALKYLNNYGYISYARSGNHDVPTAIRKFQEFFGLNVTGNLDASTIDLMKKPRCGVSDASSGDTRKRRYATWGIWSKTALTYYVQPGEDLPEYQQRQIFSEALKFWADVSGLTFREIESVSKADIKISFGRRGHKGTNAENTCPYPFDGPSGTLAHAYYPQDGRAHFDEDETFTHGTSEGVNLLWVAVHEFGHALGLQHTNVRGAIMYPYYTGYVPDMELHSDDIAGIQSLYGPNTTPFPTSERFPTTSGSSTETTFSTPETTPSTPGTSTTPETTPTTAGDCEDRLRTETCKTFSKYYCNLYPEANKYWCAKSCFNCNV